MKTASILSVTLLLLALVSSALMPTVHAESNCPSGQMPAGVAAIQAAILGLFVAIQAIIYVIIGLAWITGNMMWAAPTKSMIIKKGGQQQMEIAGISLFLTLMGPGIFAFIIFLAQQFGTFTWAFCSPT